MATAAASSEAIGYAPRPPPHRRRRVLATALVVLLLAVACLAVYYWGYPFSRQAWLIYHQRQCLEYALPPDTVVMEEDAARAAALLVNRRLYSPPLRPKFDSAWDDAPPPDWQPPAYRFCAELNAVRFIRTYSAGEAFVHERRTPGGLTRLVVVEVGATAFGPDGHYVALSGLPFIPASWQPGSSVTMTSKVSRAAGLTIRVRRGQHLRLFAGQADQTDPSHFTIRYELNNVAGTIDGWLRDPGAYQWPSPQDAAAFAQHDVVELRIRDGPAMSAFEL